MATKWDFIEKKINTRRHISEDNFLKQKNNFFKKEILHLILNICIIFEMANGIRDRLPKCILKLMDCGNWFYFKIFNLDKLFSNI